MSRDKMSGDDSHKSKRPDRSAGAAPGGSKDQKSERASTKKSPERGK